MQPFPPDSFENVFSAELEEIAKRQQKNSGSEVDRKSLAGIALSGGGIRSATTSLGVLQALKKLGILHAFDYLSTVSGGGFTGSWWSAWTSRDFDPSATKEEKFFPPHERTQPERDALKNSQGGTDVESERKLVDPVHHLRLFSNYLTPMKGPLSADTWRANAVITRNLGLTWLVLIPMLFAAVLLAQAYYTMQPRAEMEYLYPYSHFAEDSTQSHDLAIEILAMSSLDSMVHGSNSVVSLAPVRKLRELDPAPKTEDPYAQLLRNLRELRHADSAIANEGGENALTPRIEAKLDTIELGVTQWHSEDSGIRSNPNLSIEERQRQTDNVREKYRASLDPSVDTVRTRLARLDAKLIAHRTEIRDHWLFNPTHLDYLAHRAIWGSFLPVMMAGWIVMLICLWMINSGHRMFGGNILQGTYAFLSGLAVYLFLSWLITESVGTVAGEEWSLIRSGVLDLVWSIGALGLLGVLLWDDAYRFWKSCRSSMRMGTINRATHQQLLKLLEVRRSRIVTYHQRLLLGMVLVSVLLAFGAYGHEAINYLFFYHSGNSEDFWQWVARIAGIATIVTALAGTGFAARNARARNDRGEPNPIGKLKGTLIVLAPPLILVLLLCGVSWTSHWVLQALVFQGGSSVDQNYLALVFSMWMLSFLSIYYAIFDLHLRTRRSKRPGAKQFSRLLLAMVITIQFALMSSVLFYPSEQYRFTSLLWLLLPVISWAIVSWKYRWEEKHIQPAERSVSDATPLELEKKNTAVGSRIRSFGRISGASMLILFFSLLTIILSSILIGAAELPIDHLFIATLGASVLLLIFDLVWGIRAPEDGRRGNHESRILLGINVTLITLFLIIPPLAENPHWGVTHVLEVLISLSIGLVIFVGWRIDPNSLSIHEFYRDRIVRAYLGASNWRRTLYSQSASSLHPVDDIALTELTNCEQGAPYHIVNTTLNLLGTKSLETAQRHASNFIMSKRYCGSVTTGYRPTEEYMSSTMTLGTAVAISGAAASPNMGSNQVSGATTMLMSLLNIRLGYWAANPGRSRWREAQSKLWPYYLLKESLSQTSGFGAFCYLTDGGHFDNTGLYPLIERGCRYIVLCDNGADPNAHFKDLGNALRRCRIDFNVEFELDGLKDMTSMARTGSGSHWLRGTVRYCEAHVRTLWGTEWDAGLSDEERKQSLEGTILILKPALLGDEPADVLQYGLEYADFPQQSTANQWFSEDQFESYRRLGFWSAQKAFANTDYTSSDREALLRAIQEHPKVPTENVPAATIPNLAYGATQIPSAKKEFPIIE